MHEQTSPEGGAAAAPVETLKAEGYRSVFSIVEGSAFCPHCGLKRERSAFVPVKSVVGEGGDAPAWHAVTCVRCHARGLLAAGSDD